MEEEVVEVSSASNSPVREREDRIKALIEKYKTCEPEVIQIPTESISDSDDEVTLIESDKEEGNIEKGLLSQGSAENDNTFNNFCKNYESLRNSNCKGNKATVTRKEYLSESDDEDINEILDRKLKRKYLDSDRQDLAKTTRKRKENMIDKEAKKLENEKLRQKKKEEREQRQQEIAREKALKQAIKTANKNLKPEECIKYITAHIDAEILNEPFSTEILSHLTTMNISYKVGAQPIPRSVTWTRKLESHSLSDDGELVSALEVKDTEELLLLIDWKSFVNHVKNDSLSTHIKSLQSLNKKKKIYLAVVGLEAYYKYHKKQKHNEVSGATNSKVDNKYNEAPFVARRTIENTLTELQLLCNCSCQTADTPQDVAMLVGQFSKAVAQLPFKSERNEKYQQSDWYMAGEKKDSVVVDKNGNGLQRLWNQQLCCFPLARLETAEAVVSNYSTPAKLSQAYESCSSKEGEQLLQNIPVRRAVGPLTSVRKIGPELSKKIYTFFTSTDENTIL